VLPFVNWSSDSEQDYFADGITEDLTTELSKLSGLFVISRHSAFAYKGLAKRADEIGAELGVRHLLERSARRAGRKVRISAQLVDATSGTHLWAERFERERKLAWGE
jgi:TolB-like protein